MSADDVKTLRSTAEEAARRSGAILKERLATARQVDLKKEIDLVTDADRASEAALLAYLRERHPTHAILAEESGQSFSGELRWLVDPLDGTTNYAYGVPHYCVSVAVEGPQGLLAGAIYDPIRDELFSAGQGEGATLNGRPLRVRETTTLETSLLVTGFPFDVRLHPEPSASLVQRLLRRARGLLRLGSAALDLAYVAAGRLDAHFQVGLYPWDVGAGALLVKEAGGVLSRIDGSAFDLHTGDLIAAAPGIAEALQAECRAAVVDAGWSLPPRRT